MSRSTYVTVVVLAALLAGCGGAPTPVGAGTTTSTSATTPSTGPTTSPTTSAPEPTTAMGRRCGGPDAAATSGTVRGADGTVTGTTTLGTGPTVAVLLHQTDGGGACGWWPYAVGLARTGARVVLVDFCGFGDSRCPSTAGEQGYVTQVRDVVAALRTEGASRVTLVGASLGGTVALAAAGPTRADAVVDLSGFGFGTLTTAAPLATLRVPVLAAGSRQESADTDRLRAQVAASPAPTKRFVEVDEGHGYGMLTTTPFPDAPPTPLAAVVSAWASGHPS